MAWLLIWRGHRVLPARRGVAPAAVDQTPGSKRTASLGIAEPGDFGDAIDRFAAVLDMRSRCFKA